MKKTVFLVLAITLSSIVSADQLYRWTDADGHVHYTDKPPPTDAKEAEKKQIQDNAPAPTLSYATRKAAAGFPVTLYTSSGCGQYCDDAREFLQQRGIPFTEKQLSTEEDRAAFKQLFNGNENIPAVSAGSRQLVGFEAGQWNELLDRVGYPRTPAQSQ